MDEEESTCEAAIALPLDAPRVLLLRLVEQAAAEALLRVTPGVRGRLGHSRVHPVCLWVLVLIARKRQSPDDAPGGAHRRCFLSLLTSLQCLERSQVPTCDLCALSGRRCAASPASYCDPP